MLYDYAGLGAFALTAFKAGDVLFRVPRNIILSSLSPAVLAHPVVARLATNDNITAETLLFTYMILMKREGTIGYLNSLTPFAQLDASELSGTSVGAQLVLDSEEVLSQLALVRALVPGVDVVEDDFKWAKQHYNGRRYPLRFSLSNPASAGQATPSSGGSEEEEKEDACCVNPSKKQRTEADVTVQQQDKKKEEGEDEEEEGEGGDSSASTGTRRVYDPTQGSLVPLLDALNHSSAHALPLVFELGAEELVVKTSVDYAVGDEVFYNYGCESNDSFLLQFGFCNMQDERLDMVAVKAMGGGVQELRPGLIPECLLQDGGEGLFYFLKKKKKSLPSSKLPASDNPFVAYYMDRQRKVLKMLIKELDEMSYE
jgi:hypothetical protein